MARRRLRFIAIVGSKKSGKTSLASYLVRRLSRKGRRVASIKHVHHRGFTMDTPNKDSWRLTKAGSGTVVVISPDEIAQITKLSRKPIRKRFTLAVKNAVRMRPDFVVIEGFTSVLQGSSRGFRVIVMAKDQSDLAKSLTRVDGRVVAISGEIAKRSKQSSYQGIPILRFPKYGDRILAAAAK